MTKPASAFAGGERGGKSLQWEYIFDNPVPAPISTVVAANVRIVGTIQTRIVALVPVNVTRSVVTLERIRGHLEVFFSVAELTADFDNWFVHAQLQIVPARNGVMAAISALSPGNAADQESNKIIWQRFYVPEAGFTITSPGALELTSSSSAGMEIDVKVKRRFDRAVWALALVIDTNVDAKALHHMSCSLRALFRTTDGV